MDEIWKPCPGYPDYEVSSLGRVRSLKNFHRVALRILKPWQHNSGDYPAVKLSIRGHPQRSCLVHSLVCEAFHGPKPSPRHEVAHWDGVPANVAADNLRWALPAENYADSVRHGTASAATQFKPRIPDDDIREIRQLLAAGWTQSKIAAKFGIWQTAVSAIKTGRIRKKVI